MVHYRGCRKEAQAVVRIIGKRKFEQFGARQPSRDAILWIADIASRSPCVVPKGIYRYRSHEDADADMEGWKTNGVVGRVLELASRKSRR